MERTTGQRWHLYVLLASLLTPVTSVEENQPEIFLSPRNFNPHPYEAGYDPRDAADANRVGPVVFPPSPPDEDNSVNSNVLTLERERQLNHPIDNHPYAKVARKRKYQFPGRFSQQSPPINPKVYEALSKHGARVLSEPASQLRKDYTLSSLSTERKNYAFSYKVVDHLTGDDFSHTQSQNSRATNGEYRVKLPDGRVQIVSYTADKNGYKADVKYTENDLPAPNVQIQQTQIPIPILKPNSYDYHQYLGGFAPYVVSTPKSPLPLYGRQPKVQIYPNGEINGLGNYIGSTAAPYLPKAYHGDVVASTVAPTLAGYTQVYTVY